VFKALPSDTSPNDDTRIERQAWRLTQSGNAVSGFYVVELTMISGDGRPYMCSREPRFSTLLRFDVKGVVDKDGIVMEEVGDMRAKGACRPASRTPSRFRASLHGEVLSVHDGEKRITLYRRPAAEERSAANALLAFDDVEQPGESEPASFSTIEWAPSGDDDAPPSNVHGLWVWEHRGMLSSGDEKMEREEWHLVQDGAKVSGYYDRAVRQVSTDGQAYRCNSAMDFRVVTRYQISGEVRGDEVHLYERGFEIMEGSPCDTGQRRLDSYKGQAVPGEIRLMFGMAVQVLRRARPNVPTQRF
jgi:hypothetical protein